MGHGEVIDRAGRLFSLFYYLVLQLWHAIVLEHAYAWDWLN